MRTKTSKTFFRLFLPKISHITLIFSNFVSKSMNVNEEYGCIGRANYEPEFSILHLLHKNLNTKASKTNFS